MNNILAMDQLNDFCIFEILKWMNLASILAFGVTNTRFHALVSRHITAIQNRGIIHFSLETFSLANIREIMERFGGHFYHLNVDFGSHIIDMDIFQTFDGCLIHHAQHLSLHSHVTIFENDEYDGYFQFIPNVDEIPHLLNSFQRSAENIIDNLNASQIPSLRNVSFECHFEMDMQTFDYFQRYLNVYVDPIIYMLFMRLQRGNIAYTYRFEGVMYIHLILEFNNFN